MSIERLGKDKYKVRWREGGRHRSKTIHGPRIRAKGFEAKVSIERGWVDGSQTLSEFGLEWFDRHVSRLSPKTRTGYVSLWDLHIRPHLGGYRLDELTVPLIEDWLNRLERNGLGRESQRKSLQRLRGALTAANRWGKLDKNPAELTPLPKPAMRKEIHALSPEQIEHLRKHMQPRDATLVSVMGYLGLRPQEAMGLKWGDLKSQTMRVEAAKTNKPRAVKVWSPVMQDLNEYRLRSGRPGPKSFIFPSTADTKMSLDNWRRRDFDSATQKAGLTTTPYALRHSCVSLMIWAGCPITEIAQQLGHSPHMTLNTYAHVIADMAGKTPVSVEDAISAARSPMLKRAVS